MSRILLIGATGYTGRLVAHELADAGAPFVLAARNPRRLNRLAEEVGGRFETQVVDVRRPDTLWRLVRSGDAVINCAGPFTRLGDAVIRACTEAGAHYLDTTGEQAWMRSAEVRHDEAARTAGVAVVNGMAFEYALGDCAAAVAAAGMATPLRSLDVIYAWKGAASSRGTRRTALRMLGTRALVLEDRALRARPQAARRRQVRLSSNRTLTAVTFGSGEVVTVPRWADVETVRGWLVVGRRTARVAPMIAPALPYLVPVLRPALRPFVTRAPDPSEAERRASRFTIRLELEDARGATRALEVRGRDPYGLSAAIAVRGALRMLEPGARSGVLAPSQLVDAEPFLAGLRVLGVELVAERPLPDLDQLHVERERLTGQRVVQVQPHRLALHARDRGHAALPRRHLHLDLLPDLGVRAVGELRSWHLHHQVLPLLAVRVIGVQPDLATLPDLQPLDRPIEAGDHLPAADLELQRVAAARAVEYISTFQRARVMDRNGVSLLRLLRQVRLPVGPSSPAAAAAGTSPPVHDSRGWVPPDWHGT